MKDFNTNRSELTNKDIEQIFSLLNSGLRSKNRNLLWIRLNTDLNSIPHHGILSRIMDSGNGWEYCAGQSYPDEIRTVRNIILTLK